MLKEVQSYRPRGAGIRDPGSQRSSDAQERLEAGGGSNPPYGTYSPWDLEEVATPAQSPHRSERTLHGLRRTDSHNVQDAEGKAPESSTQQVLPEWLLLVSPADSGLLKPSDLHVPRG